MCRTIHALLQVAMCGVQMLVRVFMTIILMIENLIRMVLQTLYNFISFILQMLSLIPICIVFILTTRLKCFMVGGGGGGPCPVNRGGACDCIMSAIAIVILFLIFRATGILDKVFYSIGYSKARIPVYKFVPTPGHITECSRNDTDYEEIIISTTMNDTTMNDTTMNDTTTTDGQFYLPTMHLIESTTNLPYYYIFDVSTTPTFDNFFDTTTTEGIKRTEGDNPIKNAQRSQNNEPSETLTEATSENHNDWITVLNA